jgi:hypothetical protein
MLLIYHSAKILLKTEPIVIRITVMHTIITETGHLDNTGNKKILSLYSD